MIAALAAELDRGIGAIFRNAKKPRQQHYHVSSSVLRTKWSYNNRINRLSSVQEHFKMRRAIDRGISPERLSKALCVDLGQINRKVTLLDGVCPEAVDLLKDRQFSPEVTAALRRMKPARQVEAVELMIAANSITVSYARALELASAKEMLAAGKRPRKGRGIDQEQVDRMEREMSGVQDQYRMIEQGFGEDTLNLVLARGYVAKLVDNKSVFRYLERNHGAVLEQVVGLVNSTSADV
ncbi:plasmid partitioning protein RepB C-terminal domain-containing protein [Variovorax sp. CCNWLW186]|uniref:plasmid partitioning protein RepB C-terminal domain-containing protein n=1 Tax=Variovorax sp. CCNWLW186 TaxID=3127473 RepID=UPI0030788D59